MKILLLPFIFFFSLLPMANADNFFSQKKGVLKNTKYHDIDWSHSLYSNNGFPSNSEEKWNVRWLEQENMKFLRFRLFNGQVGTALKDNKPYYDNKKRYVGPYWERAEIRTSKTIIKNRSKSYDINLRLRFISGFTNYRETFFMIGNDTKHCSTFNKPSVMLTFQDSVLYMFYALNNRDSNHLTFYPEINVTNIYNKWVNFKLEISPTKFQEIHEGGLDLTLSFEGEKIWSQPMIWASKCGNAFVKVGIARPGSKQVLEKSIFDIDYLKIKEKN